jgi:CubicO group peptidase (beta-lactamase class C family)
MLENMMKIDCRFALLLLIIYGMTFALNTSQANETLELKQEYVHSEIHQANMGEITFMHTVKPIDDYRQEDLITTLNLNKSKNFYFIAFINKPLTHYLHELAPELSKEEVTNKGNYQFSFYIDSQLIYTENLNFGAGLASQKNNDQILIKPFFSEQNEDSWGRFLWMRFMHFGGEAALIEGLNKLKIEIRPYVKTPEIKIGKTIASGNVSINVTKPVATDKQIAIQPIQKNSGWDLSSDTYDKNKIRALNTKITQKYFKKISSIVIIKDGELLLEEYFNGSHRDTLHDPRSVGKSFASTMLGIAIDEGHISNKNQKISEFYNLKNFNNNSSQKANVSLKDILTMTSGFDGDDSDQNSPGNEENMYPTDDWVKFALNLSMNQKDPASKHWSYFTAGVVLLGDILHKALPGGLEAYADKKLFAPLGIENYQWQYTPQNVANTAGGLQLRALDFAKYGQLYKNGGAWKGKQILPQKWAQASLSKQVARTEQSSGGHYGYLFWNDTLMLGQQTYEVAYATGNGGNKIFIFKDLPFVIVITATAYNTAYGHSQVDQMMSNYILPAILH